MMRSIFFRHLVPALCLLFAAQVYGFAQTGKGEVREGNRHFRKGDWAEADVAYRKALLKDSTSFAATYNLANTQYRQEDMEGAAKSMEKLKETVQTMPQAGEKESGYAADYWFNSGDVAIAQKNWQAAVDAFKQAILLRPDDVDAKENYLYAKQMLQNQQGGGGGQEQNNDQNQDSDNKDQQDQNQNNNQDNKDQNQNQDQQQDQGGQDKQDQGQQPQPQDQKINQQQAQQMLQAIQAKEKETTDKVNKEKAEALRLRQKDKNW